MNSTPAQAPPLAQWCARSWTSAGATSISLLHVFLILLRQDNSSCPFSRRPATSSMSVVQSSLLCDQARGPPGRKGWVDGALGLFQASLMPANSPTIPVPSQCAQLRHYSGKHACAWRKGGHFAPQVKVDGWEGSQPGEALSRTKQDAPIAPPAEFRRHSHVAQVGRVLHEQEVLVRMSGKKS